MLVQERAAQPAAIAPRRGRSTRVVSWAAQLLVAGILAQTLSFKFIYAPETQAICAGRGGRPAAAVGVAELVCVVLLLVPRTAALGALLSLR